MGIRKYSDHMNKRMEATAAGRQSLKEHKEMMNKVKSMPRRVLSSTGSMIRRGVEAALPKREMTFTKVNDPKSAARGGEQKVKVKTRIGY